MEKQQPTSEKPHWTFSQTKYHHWEFLLSHIKRKTNFSIKKNDYRSVIDITFISDMGFFW